MYVKLKSDILPKSNKSKSIQKNKFETIAIILDSKNQQVDKLLIPKDDQQLEKDNLHTNDLITHVVNNNATLLKNYFSIKSGYKIQPIMGKQKDQNHRVCIVGASGSGKTTFASNMVKEYRTSNKQKDIFLFTRNKEDKSIDNAVKPTRIEIDEEDLIQCLSVGDPYIDIDWLKNSCCIFDDIEQTSKLLTKYLISLRMDAITNGRKLNIDIISIIHNTDFRNTRMIFSEMSMLVLFMKSSQAMNKRILKEYVGMNNKQIEELKNINSRWICIRTIYPMLVIWETGIAFI